MSWDQTMILLKAIQENGISSANGTIMMVPFSENKYGFNIKLTDIDGTTPLKDVTLSGVSNPTTELRTNSDGRVKFISDSPKHTISFDNFPSGYAYGELFVQQPVQGYINDMTEIVITPDKTKFAGYNVTLKSGSTPLAGKTVYCATNKKSYVTDSSGKINNIYVKSNTLSFDNTTSSVTEGLKATTVAKGSTTGSIGSVVTKDVAYSETTTYKINQSVPSVGSTITIGSYQYIICHIDNSAGVVYAISNVLQGSTQFSTNGSTTYSGSLLASKCTDWYNNNVPASWRNNGIFKSVTVNGVTSQCFVPSYEQFNGGFSYFSDNSKRICNLDNNPYWYWTCTADSSSRVWGVRSNGGLNNYDPSATGGFRPCLAIARSAFAS